MYLLEGVKAAVEVNSEVLVEVCEKYLEGFVRVVVDVDVPGLEEGRMICVVEFRCNLWVGEVVFLGECSGVLVGCGDGFVKVGGDDACVDVVG